MTEDREHIEDEQSATGSSAAPGGSPTLDEMETATGGRRRSRRRVLIGVGIGLLAFLMLVILPGYIATRPGFFGRYPAFQTQYKEWRKSSHAAVQCGQCHAKPSFVAQSAFRGRMAAEFYPALVTRSRVPSAFPEPSNDACIECHSDLRTVSPKGDLQIPHKAHVNILKMKCVDCHDQHLVHVPGPGGKNVPTMAGCLEKCHDGDTADNSCTSCHTEKAVPATHKVADWGKVHPAAAEANKAECEKCHGWVKDWCVDCHQRKPKSHNIGDWRATHRDKVAEYRNCEACHEAAFCERCHGEVPELNYNPELKLVQ